MPLHRPDPALGGQDNRDRLFLDHRLKRDFAGRPGLGKAGSPSAQLRLGAVERAHLRQIVAQPGALKFGRGDQRLQLLAFSLQLLRSEEHTSELQSLMRISYAVFFLKKKKKTRRPTTLTTNYKHEERKQKKNEIYNLTKYNRHKGIRTEHTVKTLISTIT